MELPKSKINADEADEDYEIDAESAFKKKQFGSGNQVAYQTDDNSEVNIVDRDTLRFTDEFSDTESFGQRSKNITDPTLVDDFVPSLSNTDYF